MRGLSDVAELRAALPALFAPVVAVPSIGLAVSGGADSLALMLLAAEWARGLSIAPRLIVYSVDHGLRPEAAAEVAFVMREARRLGLSARSLSWSGSKPVAGVQAAARAARYRLMGDAMRADGVQILLTAHHRDDQAETVLMRLAHGSGLEGLRGMDAMAEVEGVEVCRPLLEADPALLRAIVAEAGLTPVADPSNADRHYERVRWRQALPEFAELGLDAGQLARFARRAGDADTALSQWASERFAALVTIDGLGAARLPAAELAALPRAIAVRLLARVLDAVGGGQKPRALGAVERLQERLAGGAPLAPVTTLGAGVRRRGDTLWFNREAGRTGAIVATIAPAESLVWDRRFRISNRSVATVEVRMAREFSRGAAERLVGRRLAAPTAAIRSAPLVTAGEQLLALGMYRLAEGAEVAWGRDA